MRLAQKASTEIRGEKKRAPRWQRNRDQGPQLEAMVFDIVKMAVNTGPAWK
jgi:hypothetical protein